MGPGFTSGHSLHHTSATLPSSVPIECESSTRLSHLKIMLLPRNEHFFTHRLTQDNIDSKSAAIFQPRLDSVAAGAIGPRIAGHIKYVGLLLHGHIMTPSIRRPTCHYRPAILVCPAASIGSFRISRLRLGITTRWRGSSSFTGIVLLNLSESMRFPCLGRGTFACEPASLSDFIRWRDAI
jgi:hypothetical protein